MKNIFMLVCLLSCTLANSQSDNKNVNHQKSCIGVPAFHSINQIGITEGETGTSFQLQTINGVSFNYWFAGIGTAIDYYIFRTVPVFLDIRKNFFKKEKSPFIYADGGISFPWQKKEGDGFMYKTNYKNGIYYDAGLGYNLPVSKLGAFVFSIGYSEKRITEEKLTYRYPYSSLPVTSYTDAWNKNESDYRLRRITIKAGWKF